MSSFLRFLLLVGTVVLVVIGHGGNVIGQGADKELCYWETATRSGSTAEVVVWKQLTERKVGIWRRPDKTWVAGSLVIKCGDSVYTILDINRSSGNLPVFNRTASTPRKGECEVVYYAPTAV